MGCDAAFLRALERLGREAGEHDAWPRDAPAPRVVVAATAPCRRALFTTKWHWLPRFVLGGRPLPADVTVSVGDGLPSVRDVRRLRRALATPGRPLAFVGDLAPRDLAVYAGQEDNTFFARTAGGLTPLRTVAHAAGEVLALDDDVIHGVTNTRDDFTAATHVYGGDITGTPRHLWLPPALREEPFDWPLAEQMMAALNARQADEPRPWDRARSRC